MQSMPDAHRRPTPEAAVASTTHQLSHLLRFESLFDSGRALSFPCDGCGEVQMDALSERARNNYFFARAAVGRDYGRPIVAALEQGSTH